MKMANIEYSTFTDVSHISPLKGYLAPCDEICVEITLIVGKTGVSQLHVMGIGNNPPSSCEPWGCFETSETVRFRDSGM